MSQIIVKSFVYPQEFLEMEAIRCSVFQEEQGVAPELEFDGLDKTSIQLLAYLDERPVGTARIRYINEQVAKIERLAVLSNARGLGIGYKLMQEAIEIAKQNHIQEAVVHAQEYVKKLYQKLEFKQIGDVFEEAGIPHIKMIKQLK